MTTYVIAGAAGFIGANFVHFVRQQDADAKIVSVDYGGFASNAANLDGVGGDHVYVEADVADHKAVMDLYTEHKPDFVVNFAAESHNDRAITNPSLFARSNTLGAQVPLEASRVCGVAAHLHVSTIEVYGELDPAIPHFTESSPLNAKTPYSAAKAGGDQLVRSYMHTYGDMNIKLTHCANNYGPYQLPEKFLPLALTNVMRGKKVPVYGDGLQRRDWLHVVDHCRAIWAVLHAEKQDIPHEAAFDSGLLPIYDISARVELTNLDILTQALKHLGVDPAAHIEHVEDRPNHDRRYLINPAKIETELNWSPSLSFEDGLKATADWYVQNEAWWHDAIKSRGEMQFDWAQTKA